MHCFRTGFALICLLVVVLLPAQAMATTSGLRAKFDLGLRYQPLGTAIFSDLSYRYKLTDSEETLRKNTYVEGGFAGIASPAYARPGLFIEAVPLAILKLRLSAQYARYFGTFGFLFIPEDEENPSWEIEDFDRSADESAGVAGGIFIVESLAQPRIRVGNLVALVDIQHVFLKANLDQLYYEPYYDLVVEPTEQLWYFRPTLGYLPYVGEDSFVLTALRYERMFSVRSDEGSHQLAAILSWGLPGRWSPRAKHNILLLGGYWISHPTERPSVFGALKYTIELGAR